MSLLRAVVIGCGNIGGLCDSPADDRVISHAHAYHTHPKFEISCCCDTNESNLAVFRERWGEQIRPFNNVDDLFQAEDFEVVSIATSTETHARILSLALEKESVKLIICEKPMVATINEIEQIKQRLTACPDKTVLINFQRAYDPGLGIISEMLRTQELGETLYFSAVFRKGLYHNACHLLEMIERFFGGLRQIESNHLITHDNDYFGRYYVVAGTCDGHIASVETEQYWLLDMDIYCRDGRIRLSDSGHQIEVFQPKDWSLYPGVRRLELAKTVPDSLRNSMQNTLEHGYRLMTGEDDTGIFERHLALSEKLLVMKQAFEQGKTLVDWTKKTEVGVI